MKVSRGFSEEISHCKWAKADIELDEGDLDRTLLSNGIPVEQWEHLTLGQRYAILSQQAEVLCYREYIKSLTSAGIAVSQHVRDHFGVLNLTVAETIKDIKEVLAEKAPSQ